MQAAEAAEAARQLRSAAEAAEAALEEAAEAAPCWLQEILTAKALMLTVHPAEAVLVAADIAMDKPEAEPEVEEKAVHLTCRMMSTADMVEAAEALALAARAVRYM